MAKRTTKRQQARELAMQALAERLANQEKIKDAIQRAYLAQSELDGVRKRFAFALQELDQLGETHTWLRESFGLTATELRQLLALDTDTVDDDEDNDEGRPEDDESTALPADSEKDEDEWDGGETVSREASSTSQTGENKSQRLENEAG